MSHTQILFRDDGRAKLLAGADMFERGIIDSIKVLRVALENAASVAGVLLLSKATPTEVEEKREEPQPVKSAEEGFHEPR